MTDPREVVRAFLATFSTGDVDAILGMMTEDADWWVAGTVEGISGRNGRKRLGELLREVNPLYADGRLAIEPLSMVVEGEKVACEARSFAKLADGRVYANQYHFLFETEGGRITGVREYSDTHHMVEIFMRR